LGGKKKKTHEEFVKEVYSLAGDGYTVLGQYINTTTKVLIRHNTCGSEYLVFPRSVFRGSGCMKCFGNIKKTTQQVRGIIQDLVGSEYSLIGEYSGANEKMEFIHNACMKNFFMSYGAFVNHNHRCPNCMKNKTISDTEFTERVLELGNGEYTVLGKFVNTKTKVKVKHVIKGCGYEWSVLPDSFLNKQSRCPKCNESKGERRIHEILTSKGMPYNEQHVFAGLVGVGGGLLKFDASVFKDKEKRTLWFLIEFDGIQHLRWVKGFYTEENFIKLQYHDKLKDNYCLKYGIPLLRISYQASNTIEETLTKFIKELS